MANSVEIGCESGNGNAIQTIFEAIKANGTVPDLNVQNNQALLYFSPNTSYLTAVGVRVGPQYYVALSLVGDGIVIRTDIFTYGNNAARFVCNINYTNSVFYLDRTTGSTYLSAYNGQIECCYLPAVSSYDQLMSQLGGGIKPYYILSPIIILEVREYGK